MEYLKNNQMHESIWWEPVFSWLKDNTIIFLSFAVAWRGIDRGFKFLSEGRDGRTREIVKAEVKPLEEKIDHLVEVFYTFKNK